MATIPARLSRALIQQGVTVHPFRRIAGLIAERGSIVHQIHTWATLGMEPGTWSGWVSALITSFAVFAALLPDTAKKLIGRAPKLKLDVLDNESIYHRGWVFDDDAAEPEPRIRAWFYRAKVTNVGGSPAKRVVLALIKITDEPNPYEQKLSKHESGFQRLRWSDTWRFSVDTKHGYVTGIEPQLELPELGAKHHAYCDICFFTDPEKGEVRVAKFIQPRHVYFAVANLPSSSYSISGQKRYLLEFQLTSSNTSPVVEHYVIEANFDKYILEAKNTENEEARLDHLKHIVKFECKTRRKKLLGIF